MENHSTLSRDRVFRKRAIKVCFSVFAAIALLYAILFSVENFIVGVNPGGAPGSSYASIGSGARAWSELLASSDYKVVRDKGTVTLPDDTYFTQSTDELSLVRATNVVVVLDGALPKDESRQVKDFVRQGGRLITDNPYLLNEMLSNINIDVDGATGLMQANSQVDGLEDIKSLKGSGYGSIDFAPNRNAMALARFTDKTGDFENEFQNQSETSAAIFKLGQGDVIALVDPGMVWNQNLALYDNALFSLQIAGAPGNKVTFAEGVHGYSDARGFAGMPMPWRIGIVGLFVAFVVFGAAKGRRFGVGEQPDRELGPRRIYFAHAIGTALKKSKG